MKTIIAGSRDISTDDYDMVIALMDEFCEEFGTPTEVVSGECRGVDQMGRKWAEFRRIPVKPFPYLKRYGKAGGPMRNRQMAEYADALAVLWDMESNGTKNMIEEAKKRGLPVLIMDSKSGEIITQ